MHVSAEDQEVAIVGISCRFPGARNAYEFWKVLAGGVSTIREIPPERWSIDGFYSPDFEQPNRSVSKWGGFLDEIDKFDHRFFNISPREAKNMDPQQRLLLEEVWHAIEDSGVSPHELRARKTAVYVGMMQVDYSREMTATGIATDAYACSGNISSILANRISFVLGLNGPSITLDTACSASLVALHQARLNLQGGLCDYAIVAGVSLNLAPWKYLSFSKARMLSPDGQCKTFDKDANGYVPGEGIGVLLLQPAKRARASGCHVYGLLKGSAVNHGGEALSLTAPRVPAQRDVIIEAWESAKLSPTTCSYIEAHGTGTSLGDPIEIEALTQAFRRYTDRTGHCRIGSVKTNVGHLEPAAGIAGVIKVLLMMQHGEFVPTLNVRTPNPLINFERSACRLALERSPWRSESDQPLRAGVSSFGFGGVNSHVVLESAAAAPSKNEEPGPEVFLLSARSETALENLRRAWLHFLSGTSLPLVRDACRTLQAREAFSHRLAVVVNSWDDVREGLTRPATVGSRTNHRLLIRGRGLSSELYDRAKEIVDVTTPPAVLSGEGPGLAAALALAGIVTRSNAVKLACGERCEIQPGRPRIPFFDPVSQTTIQPFRVSDAYLKALVGNPQQIDLAALETHCRQLYATQHTFRRNLDGWKPALAAGGFSLDKLWNDRDPSGDQIFAIVLCDALRKLHKKWQLDTTRAFPESEKNELLDLVEDGVLEPAALIQLLRQPGTPVSTDGSKINGAKPYQQLREFNRALNEIPDLTAWYEAAQSLTVSLEGAVVIGERPRLEVLTELWRGGSDVKWERINSSTLWNRVSLPLYPFDGERFWIREKRPVEMTLNYDSTLDTVVRDHRIDGRIILPAAAMLSALQSVSSGNGQLRNFIIRRSVPVESRATLTATNAAGRLELKQDGAIVAEALLDENSDLGEASEFEFPNEARLSGPELYEVFRAAGYDYGASLQVIRTCAFDTRAAVFELSTPDADCDANAAILDGALQAGLAAGRLLGFTKGDFFLPSRIGIFAGPHAMPRRCFVFTRSENFKAAKGELETTLEIMGTDCQPVAFLKSVVYQAAMRTRLQPGNEFATPATPSSGSGPQPAEGLDSDSVMNRMPDLAKLKHRLAELLGDVLQVKSEQVDPETDLRDYGLDSVSLTEYAELVEQKLQVNLEPTLLFQHPTLGALAAHLAKNFSGQLSTTIGSAAVISPEIVRAKAVAEIPAIRSTSSQPTRKAADPSPRVSGSEIAIVGVAARFPGAENLAEWWMKLAAGQNLVTEVPEDRWDWREYFGDPHSKPNKTCSKWGGFLSGIDHFDASFFRISPREASLMDPQQRLMLQLAWHALEDAGVRPSALRGSRTGVFVGVCNDDYRELIDAHAGAVDAQTSTGTYFSIIPNRISYWFDFHGPSVAVDTACSSSLVAIHQAIQAIQSGDCEAALAGGINICCTPRRYISFAHAGMLSPEGACRTFDRAANGYVRGEGGALLLLKPLERALADGNPIYGLVRASGVNHGGSANSLTAPNPNAQAELLSSVFRRGSASPESIGYIEAHGTGTALGDPLEVLGLKSAFAALGLSNTRQPTCGLGSVKTNIGHLESAAGVAGVVKVLLALKHKTLPASLHFQELNPHITLEQSPFYIVDRTQPWNAAIDSERRQLPRRAGVSSFGFGGVNAHVLIEEAPLQPNEAAVDGPELVLLSARTSENLKESARLLASWLPANSSVSLREIAFTLQVGREDFETRLALVVSTVRELKEKLERYVSGIPVDYCGTASASVLEDAPEDSDFLQRLFTGGRLDRLARFWVTGADIPWERFYGPSHSKRISLPGYAFSKERHWIRPQKPARESGVPDNEIAATDPLVRDHVVVGEQILPGVVYLDRVCTAAARRNIGVTALRNVLWLRPFVVNTGRASLEIDFKGDDGSFSYEAASTSDGNRTVHASGGIVTTKQPEPASADLDGIRVRCTGFESGEKVYQTFRSARVEYGSYFSGLKEVRFSETEFLGRIEFDSLPPGSLLHPPVMDSAVQVILWWLIRKQGVNAALYLPFSASAVNLYREIGRCCFVHLIAEEINLESGFAQATVRLIAENGSVLVELRDFCIRRFAPHVAATPESPRFLRPVWRSEPLPPTVLPRSNVHRLIFTHAHDGGLGLRLKNENSRLIFLGQREDLIGGPCAAIDCRRQKEFETAVANVPEGSEIYFLGAAGDGLTGDDNFDTARERTVLSLFRLIKALVATGMSGHISRVWVLTSHAAFVTAADARVDPLASATAAFAESIGRELPELPFSLLDVTPGEATIGLAAEVCRGKMVAIRSGRVYRRVLEPLVLEGTGAALPLISGDTCLIAGGAGGLGFETAKFLASRSVNLVLTGRRPLDSAIGSRLTELRKLAVRALYVRADVANTDQMRAAVAEARRELGPIHGAIHSALVLKDASIGSLTEEALRDVLRPKVDGMIALAEALRDEPLKTFVAFSSANSFLANAGQSSYVAACAFKDAFCLGLARERELDVRVINWGFWGETGIVAGDAYKTELAARGIYPLSNQEGITALEKAWSAPVDQVVAGRFSASVQDELGVSHNTRSRWGGAAMPRFAREVARGLEREVVSTGNSASVLSDVAAYGALRLLHFFQETRCFQRPNEPITLGELRTTLRVTAKGQRILDALLDTLLRAELISQSDGSFALAHAASSVALPSAQPGSLGYRRLIDHALQRMGDVLAGMIEPLEAVFPGGSSELVAGIYSGNPVSDYYNELLALSLRHYLNARRVADSRASIRILEIGAGVGGTTRRLLKELPSGIEYVFTEISPALVNAAEKEFEASSIRFQCLNIEETPEAELRGRCDVVVATNVLHATRDVSVALTNVKALLKPNGLFLLNEVTRQQPYLAMAFGLLDGWWRFEDAELRIANAPILTDESWRRVLRHTGFRDVSAIGGAATNGAQTVFLAESNGLVQEDTAAVAAIRQTYSAVLPAIPERQHQEPLAMAVAPASNRSIDSIVTRVISEATGQSPERIHAEARFVDLGIDSILGIQIINKLNQALGLNLKTTTLFNYTSVAELSAHIRDKHQPRPAAVTTPAPDPATVSPTSRVEEAPTSPRASVIAVIGMSGRFPGARNLDEFWANLAGGVESIREVPIGRWGPHSEFFDQNPGLPNRSYLKSGGFLDGVEEFDPLFFDISPREAELMDPQQRLFLEESWKAIEDAGYSNRDMANRKCGVFAGVSKGDYFEKMHAAGLPLNSHTWIGNETSILSARLAYHLNLKGPAFPVDTACSSSLVALHLACQSLLAGECEFALVGGVFILTTPSFYIHTSKTLMLSPEGRCKAFDNGADGFVPGEGAAAVLLKPLEAALRDNDHIYGVIRGCGVNQDGKTNGITAPNGVSQQTLIEEVYRKAGINPESISYVETHGTGTKLGDPIEVEALTDAFRTWTKRTQFCAIGSVKTNIGHTATVAGLAGLIKILLALRNGAIPPSLNFRIPNENIRFEETPFSVNTRLAEWKRVADLPRRAALSSFGFSGTNAHVLIEDAPVTKARVPVPPETRVFCLSAKSRESLEQKVDELVAWLQKYDIDLADLAYTLNCGRSHFAWRLAVKARDRRELLEALTRKRAAIASLTPVTAKPQPPELVHSLRESDRIIEAYLHGREIDWQTIYRGSGARRISAPTYAFQRLRCWPFPAVPEVGLNRRKLLLFPTWTKAPPVPPVCIAKGRFLVIDETGEGVSLPTLAGVSWHFIHNTGSRQAATGNGSSLHFESANEAEALVSQLLSTNAVAGVIHFVPRNVTSRLQNGILRLYQCLLETSMRRDLRLVLVMSGGAVNPLAGLIRVLAAEYRTVNSTVIEIDDSAKADSAIVTELSDPTLPLEVRYASGERQVRAHAEIGFVKGEFRAHPSRAYLITGGTGGLGFETARFLIRRGATKLILLCRKLPLTPEKQARVDELQRLGASVVVGAPHLNDASELSNFLSDARRKLGVIGGVFHCAGVVGQPGTPFTRKPLDEMQRVLSPKVEGLQTLVEALAHDPVEQFIFFSSVAAAVPSLGVGAAEYAAANAFMDQFATARYSAGQRGFISLNWPSWKETGIGEIASGKFTESGLLSLTTAEGIELLEAALTLGNHPNLIPIVVDPARFSLQRLFAPKNITAVVGSSRPSSGSAGEAKPDLERRLLQVFSHELKIPIEQFDPQASFGELGVDSVLLAELVKKIEPVLGQSLDPSLLIEHPSVRALSEHLGKGRIPVPSIVSASEAPQAVADHRIAIIGIACRFPGAEDKEAFWTLLRGGGSGIREVPSERWAVERFYDARGGAGKSVSKWGGFLDGIELFDPAYFGISAEQAAQMDPLARLFLEVGVQAIRDAGYSKDELWNSATGVFVGSRTSTFSNRIEEFTRDTIVGIGQNFIAAQIAQFHNFRGPNLVIDTACSSSLASLHYACQSLASGECDLALAGGVDLLLDEKIYLMLSEAKALSPTGKCHTFDLKADGYVPGEGCGAVLLKPLARAMADGDLVYGVIAGSAINNDGHTMGITTPSVDAQEALIRSALRKARLRADAITFIEAHGTGTMIGDPIELKALTRAFRHDTDARQYCGIGSVKSNVGHLHSAAGICSAIKVALALKARELPPTLNCDTPNPRFDFDSSPFYPITAKKSWEPRGDKRCAGISSFGFGGTNCHVILEEFVPVAGYKCARTSQPPVVFNRERFWPEAREPEVNRLHRNGSNHRAELRPLLVLEEVTGK